MNDGRQSIDEAVEHAVGVLTTSEVGDKRAGQRQERADSHMMEWGHAAHKMP